MAELSLNASRSTIRLPSWSDPRIRGRRTRRGARFSLPIRRAFATCRYCNDKGRMDTLLQCFGWLRGATGWLEAEGRRLRVEGGRTALDAVLVRRTRPLPDFRGVLLSSLSDLTYDCRHV